MDNQKNSAGSLITITLIFGLAYAVLRYHIMGPVPWKDFPFFILNKGISLGAFILLTFNFSFGPLNNLGLKLPEGWLNARKALGMTGFLLEPFQSSKRLDLSPFTANIINITGDIDYEVQ